MKSINVMKKNSCFTGLLLGYSEGGTYVGAVVDLLPHVVADALQLQLRHLLHWSHHVRDGLGAVVGAAARLRDQKKKRERRPE